jgi:hypothetical protein
MWEIGVKDSTIEALARRVWKARPRKAGTLIARNLIVRALRSAHLSHVLKGQAAIVGIIYPPSLPVEWLVEAGDAVLRRATPMPQACTVFRAKGRKTSKDRRGSDLANLLTENHVVFGFATDPTHFPDVFQMAADRIISLASIDRRAVDVAFRAVLGIEPANDLLEEVDRFPPLLLGALLKRGRSSNTVANILRRSHSNAGGSAPKLEALAGFGEAAAWGKALAADLADYAAGRIPWTDVDRGALISGPSGTGKTMFAQALGATCGIPVHAHSLARWQAQGHLGDLLAPMHGAFDQAIDTAPCILFLDEMDSFGSRDRFSGNHEQYCREVVNGLLERLDGLTKRQGVVVIGATNLPEKLDPALLRPGRLGRHFRIALPDTEARRGILRHHLGANLPGADLSYAVSCLDGATGAVIEQVVRDARRRARTERREIAITDITVALPARIRLSDSAFVRTCIHEAGHALVGRLLSAVSGTTVVEAKVSREPMAGRAGVTTFERTLGFDKTKAGYVAEITVLLAGLAAEAVVLGEHADGGGGSTDSDLYQATLVAAQVEASLGLGQTLTYMSSTEPEQLIERLKNDPALRQRVDTLLGECMSGARALLEQNRQALHRMAQELAAQTGVDRGRFSGIIGKIAAKSIPRG